MRPSTRRWLVLLLPLLALLVGWGWWRAIVAERQTRRELARQVEALKNEREARARAAREALDVAAPDEVLVVLPRPTPTMDAK